MPLSEQEQRLLDEMERNLLHNDADVVSASGGRSFSYRNLVYGALLVVAGLIGLIVGVMLFRSLVDASYVGIIVGVVGFAIMFAGVMVAMRRADNGIDLDVPAPRAHSTTAPSGGPGFMDRMNDRWDRRQDPDR